MNIENVPDHFAREYALVSGVAHRAVPEQEKLIAQTQRLVEIVQRAQNGDAALPRRLFRLVDDELFVCDIEIAGRLIENEQTRLLHERAGDGDLLLLAAGELLRAAVGKRLKMHLGENVLGGLDILASRLHAEAGDPPEQDRVEHAQRAEMDVLRHISDELCPLAPRHFQKIPAVEADRAALRRGKAENALKKRRFARAVFAEKDPDLAVVERERNAPEHRLGPAGIPKDYIFQL